MNRLVRTCTLLGVLGAFACDEAPTTLEQPDWAPPVVAFSVQDEFGTEGECMEDVVETVDGSNAVPLVCTANDLDLFFTVSAGGSELPLCLPGDPLPDLEVEANFVATAGARYDIGIWIRDDNLPIADALRGDCRHWSLVEGGDPATDPYFDGDGDTCGDLEQDVQATLGTLVLTGLTCQDTDGDGMLDIGACVGYDNNNNTDNECTDASTAPAATRPNTKSKCQCGPMEIPVRIAGKIIVEKQTVPDGAGASFTFTGDLDGSISDGGTIELLVEEGQYSTTEGALAGWDLTDITCDDDDSSGNVGTRTATFNVDAGEEVKCTFTNTQEGSIVVKKVMVGGTSTFDFTGSPSGSISVNNGTISQAVDPGQYVSTEAAEAGWTLTSIVCNDENSTGNTTTRAATFNVAAGETVTCTFTNTKDGSITIEKQTLPNGDAQSFTFTGDVAGSLSDGQTATESVVPGQYTSTEAVPSGWDLTSIVCDDANSSGNTTTGVATFNVEAGENVKCVFTNTKDGSITIEKQTLPDGDAQTFSFAGDVSGTLGDGDDETESVAPGSYTSTETVPDGWDLTDITCDDGDSSGDTATGEASFEVDPGEDVTCVFTNTKRATVEVNKRESGALPAAGAFEFQIRSGASVTENGTVIASGTNDAAGVVAFSCTGGDPTACTDVAGVAHFVPGDYQLCEVNMAAGWANNIDGWTPDSEIPEGSDNGNECVDIVLGAGDSGVPDVPTGDAAVPDPIDNTPPPGGDARTIGYWKNHSCMAPGNQEDVLSDNLPIQLTDSWLINNCATVVYLLDKRDITGNHKKMASDAAYALAAQLAAALLNVNATAATCPVPTSTIDAAQTLLHNIGFDGSGSFIGNKHPQRATALGYAAILDDWNNNDCP